MNVCKKVIITGVLYLSIPLCISAEVISLDNIQSADSVVTFKEVSNAERESRWAVIEEKLKKNNTFDATIFENSKNAERTDASIYAKSHGLSIESVEKTVRFQEAFIEYVNDIQKKYPNQISSMYMEVPPAIKGHIQFIDKVPEKVHLAVTNNKQEHKIILTGGGKFSLDENNKRARIVAKSLSAGLKNKNLGIYFDSIDKVIKVDMKLPFGAEEHSKKSLVNIINNSAAKRNLKGKASVFNKEDIQFIISRGNEGMDSNTTYSRGGSTLSSNGTDVCTSSWPVFSPQDGLYGMMTAGHCLILNAEIDSIFDHEADEDERALERRSHFGNNGDVGFIVMFTAPSLLNFHASDNVIRILTHKRITTLVGTSVCFYGRVSNIRECTTVKAVDYTTGDGAGSMIQVNNTFGIAGDSGGGWSWSTTAFGTHKGTSDGYDVYTPIPEAEEALNVYLRGFVVNVEN